MKIEIHYNKRMNSKYNILNDNKNFNTL